MSIIVNETSNTVELKNLEVFKKLNNYYAKNLKNFQFIDIMLKGKKIPNVILNKFC